LRFKIQVFADLLVLFIAVFLLIGPSSDSRSATSVGIFIVGIIIMLLLYRSEKLARYIARHLKVLAVSIILMYLLFYDLVVEMVTAILKRDETLTGRTEIWSALIDFAASNPILGAGYGGFWAPGNMKLEDLFSPRFILAQAHNGYLAVYVELGVVGIVLLAVFLKSYCDKVRRELNHTFEWGIYGICLLPMSLLYNCTEISFLQTPSYLWSTMVLLTIVFSESYLHKKRN